MYTTSTETNPFFEHRAAIFGVVLVCCLSLCRCVLLEDDSAPAATDRPAAAARTQENRPFNAAIEDWLAAGRDEGLPYPTAEGDAWEVLFREVHHDSEVAIERVRRRWLALIDGEDLACAGAPQISVVPTGETGTGQTVAEACLLGRFVYSASQRAPPSARVALWRIDRQGRRSAVGQDQDDTIGFDTVLHLQIDTQHNLLTWIGAGWMEHDRFSFHPITFTRDGSSLCELQPGSHKLPLVWLFGPQKVRDCHRQLVIVTLFGWPGTSEARFLETVTAIGDQLAQQIGQGNFRLRSTSASLLSTPIIKPDLGELSCVARLLKLSQDH